MGDGLGLRVGEGVAGGGGDATGLGLAGGDATGLELAGGGDAWHHKMTVTNGLLTSFTLNVSILTSDEESHKEPGSHLRVGWA